MSDPGDHILLEHMRYMRAAIDEVRQNVKGLNTRVGFLEEGQARLVTQYAHISTRLDRVDLRLERIETRVGPIGA